jgi:predicted ribonuclease YlaK
MVVADEMQNASAEQLKLLQNRQGSFTKLVIIGDPKQKKTRSGKTSDVC